MYLAAVHLGAGAVGAVGVAAGDAGRGDRVDVLGVGRAGDVAEPALAHGGELERPSDEGGHLAAADGLVGPVGAVGVPAGDALRSDGVDVARVGGAGDVAEAAAGDGRQVGD